MTNIQKGRFTQLVQRVARNVGQAGVRGVKGFQNLERKIAYTHPIGRIRGQLADFKENLPQYADTARAYGELGRAKAIHGVNKGAVKIVDALESAGIIHSRQAKKARFAIGLTNLSEMNNERHRSFIPKKIKSDADDAYNRYVNSGPVEDGEDDWALEEYHDYINRKHPLQHIDDARNKLTIDGGDNLRIIEMRRKGKGWLKDSKPKLKFSEKIEGYDGPDIRYRMMNNYQTAKKITALATAGGLGLGALALANRKKDATPSSSGKVNKSMAKRANTSNKYFR
jgi:hypothetical protein